MLPLTSFARIGVVAHEMHHLLWNPNRTVRNDGVAWWNCADVAGATAARMWFNGCEVDAWAGKVFLFKARSRTVLRRVSIWCHDIGG
jgi:hypothetical protein